MAKLSPRFLQDISSIYIPQTEAGAVNGVATLDSSGKVPFSQLPATIFEFKGNWDPSTNTPTLVDGTGTSGWVYYVSVMFAGPVAGLSNPTMVNFEVGNLIIYNGTQWEQTTPASGVTSVNGAQGAVTVNAVNQLTGDVTTTAASGSQSKAASLVATANNTLTTLSALSLPGSQVTGNISGNSGNVNGVVAISNGGTGQTAQQQALNAIAGATTSGNFLRGNGTNVVLGPIQVSDVPILNQNTTGTAANITASSNTSLSTLSSLVTAGSLQTVGTITTGIWNGTATGGSSFLTSGTTYTTPAGTTIRTTYRFTIIGAGGGGGASNGGTQHGAGGGSGGVGVLYISGLSPSTGYTIAIGTAGAAGDGTIPSAGSAGGNTTLTIGATTYTANGGGGGGVGASQKVGGVGGTALNCTINLQGQNGEGTGALSSAAPTSNGGSTPLGYGMGGVGHATFFVEAGYFGTGYGAGGAGGFGATCYGGAGSPGAILVDWKN